MINEITVEGLVIRTWTVIGDNFYRLACFRDPGLPARPRGELRDTADFVTVRVPDGTLGGPVCILRDDQLRVHGFLQSRDYQESLADFTREAHGPTLKLLDGYDPRELTRTRSTNEVVAQRIVRMDGKAPHAAGVKRGGTSKSE